MMWWRSQKRESVLVGRGKARVDPQGGGRIRLCPPEPFSRTGQNSLREFLLRVLSVREVRQVEIGAGGRTCDIHCPATCNLKMVVRALARALSSVPTENERLAIDRLWIEREEKAPLRVFRHGTVLATWQIVHQLTGRLRLRHDLLFRNPDLVSFLEQELSTVHGITRVKGRRQTGSLLIHYHPAAIGRDTLLHVAEQLLHDYHSLQNPGFLTHASGGAAANGSLALAAMADFVVPALMPASAAMLLFLQRKNFGAAVRDLSARRAGLPLLYTIIVAGTLANGAFFAAAAMGWFMTFWDRRYHQRVAAAQRQMLRDFTRRTSEAWICTADRELPDREMPDQEMKVPCDQLRAGQVISIEAGELICVDGIVISGEGVVDERLVQGSTNLVPKLQGDWVYASSRLLEGGLKVRATRTGDGTRAAAIAAVLRHASTPSASSLHLRGEAFARRAIAPTFAAAGAGLAVGDLTTALAVLRPDYASGPGMAIPLGTLEDLLRALDNGVVVRDATLFERLREVDLIVLDVHEELAVDPGERSDDDPIPLPWTASLRACRDVKLVLVSTASGAELAESAHRLGADGCYGDLTPGDKAALVGRRTAAGYRVAYVGDCEANDLAAGAAQLAISTLDFSHNQPSNVAAFLMQPECDRVGKLWEIALARHRRNQVTYGCTLAPNLACVAGALLLDFSVLSAVLISNLGVFASYRNVTGWLSGARGRDPQRRIVVRRVGEAARQTAHGESDSPPTESHNKPALIDVSSLPVSRR